MAQASSIVGVRELRQNLSVYLRRVEAGETLRVTDRGRPVALLGPLPGGRSDRLSQLIAAGLVTPAEHDLLSVAKPRSFPAAMSLQEALDEQRDERLP